MKINLLGMCPWITTAYGQNTRDLINILSKEHEVTLTSLFGLQGGSITYNGIEINPLYSLPHQGDSLEWVKFWFEQTKSDIILQHFDIWIMPYNWIKQADLPVITYTPIDSLPLSDVIAQTAQGALVNIAMSKYAQKAFEGNEMPTTYIPHWVDHEKFFPENQMEARKRLELPEDAFIFGMVGTNKGPRKNIPGVMLALKNLLLAQPDANVILYLHSNMVQDRTNPEGYRLNDLAEDLDILPYIRYTNKTFYLAGLNDEVMRDIYSAFDVLLQPSLGEGFGIPIVEAQACGIPVLGSDNSAITEVIGEGGWLIEINNFLCNQKTNTWFELPSVEHLTSSMRELYNNQDLVKDKKPFALANSKRYSLKRAEKLWLNLLRDFG